MQKCSEMRRVHYTVFSCKRTRLGILGTKRPIEQKKRSKKSKTHNSVELTDCTVQCTNWGKQKKPRYVADAKDPRGCICSIRSYSGKMGRHATLPSKRHRMYFFVSHYTQHKNNLWSAVMTFSRRNLHTQNVWRYTKS